MYSHAERENEKKEDFCAKCYEIPGWVIPYGDWQKTDLGAQGITCQSCHMESPQGSRAYHGFDSFVITQTIYQNDITLDDVHLDFPMLSMTIENRIAAMACLPVGQPAYFPWR